MQTAPSTLATLRAHHSATSTADWGKNKGRRVASTSVALSSFAEVTRSMSQRFALHCVAPHHGTGFAAPRRVRSGATARVLSLPDWLHAAQRRPLLSSRVPHSQRTSASLILFEDCGHESVPLFPAFTGQCNGILLPADRKTIAQKATSCSQAWPAWPWSRCPPTPSIVACAHFVPALVDVANWCSRRFHSFAELLGPRSCHKPDRAPDNDPSGAIRGFWSHFSVIPNCSPIEKTDTCLRDPTFSFATGW